MLKRLLSLSVLFSIAVTPCFAQLGPSLAPDGTYVAGQA